MNRKIKLALILFVGIAIALFTKEVIKQSSFKRVSAKDETKQVASDGDAADDPTLWINPKNTLKSIIIATNKKGGLMAYDLNGNEIQYLQEGLPNNIDLRQNTLLNGKSYDIAAATNRKLNTISLYQIKGEDKKPITKLNLVGDDNIDGELISHLKDVYGICMHKNKESTPYIFVTSKTGEIEQWKLTADKKGISGKLIRNLTVNTQTEGCVVDDETDTLYIAEEDVGIWRFSTLEQSSIKPELFSKVDEDKIVEDLEGLTIYNNGIKKYLIASSQGNNSYAVFNIADKKYLGSFKIKDDEKTGVDGTNDTDGIDVTPVYLGNKYPKGMFIAQDFSNKDSKDKEEHQNFKFVSWEDIEKKLGL